MARLAAFWNFQEVPVPITPLPNICIGEFLNLPIQYDGIGVKSISLLTLPTIIAMVERWAVVIEGEVQSSDFHNRESHTYAMRYLLWTRRFAEKGEMLLPRLRHNEPENFFYKGQEIFVLYLPMEFIFSNDRDRSLMSKESLANERKLMKSMYGDRPYISKARVVSVENNSTEVILHNRRNSNHILSFKSDTTCCIVFTNEDLKHLKAHPELVPLWMEGNKSYIEAFRRATKKRAPKKQATDEAK